MIKIFLIGIICIKNQTRATYFSNLICGLLGRRRADELLLRCAAGWSSQQKLSLSILGCAGVDTHRGRLKEVRAALRCVRVGAGRRKLRERRICGWRANVCVYVCTVWKSNALSRCREHALLHVPLRDGDVTDGSRDVTSPRAASMCRQSRGSQRDPRESGRDRRRPPQRQRRTRGAAPARSLGCRLRAPPLCARRQDKNKVITRIITTLFCAIAIKDIG